MRRSQGVSTSGLVLMRVNLSSKACAQAQAQAMASPSASLDSCCRFNCSISTIVGNPVWSGPNNSESPIDARAGDAHFAW